MLKGPGKTIRRARSLRRAMTMPEVLLWGVLRLRPNGLKFRRQHPAGAYVLDFFCSDARLAIEIDGIAHDLGERPETDETRDKWLEAQGVQVLRLPAGDVLADVPGAVGRIVAMAASRVPLHQPAAGPPPRSGEE